MGQRPKELTPHESLHHYWGAELRALRVAKGLSLADLGQRVHCNPSYLGKIERGERPIPSALVDSCDRALDAHGTLTRLHALARSGRELTDKPSDSPRPDVASAGVHVANEAGSLTGGAIFPATAGTGPDTGENILVPARTTEGRVVLVSVPRRAFLHGLGTAALTTTIPSITLPTDIKPIEHFQQLRQALIDNDRLFGPRHVIPIAREQIGIMQQLRCSRHGADQQAITGEQIRYTDFCGWLYQDLGEHRLAQHWIDRALALTHLVDDSDLTAEILISKADLSCDTRAPVDAVGAGERALRMALPGTRVAAIAPAYAAHGYALIGDHKEMSRAYDRARELLRASDSDPDAAPGPWFDETWINLRQAQSLAVLGDHHRSAQSFLDALAYVPGRYRRGRGVWLARTCRALVADQQIEQAATLGHEALSIGVDTGSGRILTELRHLNDALAPWNDVSAVADFRAAMKDTVLRPV